MPTTYFYAADEDVRLLLELAIHGKHPCQVFETQSQVNSELLEFRSAEEALGMR